MQLTLVGASFRPKEAKEVLADLSEGDTVYLVREGDNRYDSNAIQIFAEPELQTHIGYVAKHEAAEIAEAMDDAGDDEPYEAVIEAKPSRWSAILTYSGPGSNQ